jgi:hypothetical protein
MLAKKRSDRYSSPSDLLQDLMSVKNGGPPIFARQTLDVSDLESLEDGMAIEPASERHYPYATVMKYRIAVAVLSATTLLLLIMLIWALTKQ